MDSCLELDWILCELGINFYCVIWLNFWVCLLFSIIKFFLIDIGDGVLDYCVY